MTSYKSQGQTLQCAILDYHNGISKHGHFYVGATRVRSADALFVRNFVPSQIQCRDDVKRELQILRKNKPYTFSKTYLDTKIWSNADEIKIGYLNINGLKTNVSSLNKDINLSEVSIIIYSINLLNKNICSSSIFCV